MSSPPQKCHLPFIPSSWKSLTRSSFPRARNNRPLVVLTWLLLLIVGNATLAEQTEPTFEFHIEAQAADLALTEFAEQADLTLVFPDELVQERTANQLIGTYTLEEGAKILLSGTGLAPTFSNQVVMSIAIDEPSMSEGENMDIKKKAGFLAAVAAVFTGANAQETETTDEPEAKEEVLEQIIVTGSRIRGAESASPIVTIDRVELDRSGFATVEEVIENLPQNYGAGATSDATSDANVFQIPEGQIGNLGGGTSVNLRGLGTSSTLVLINGRRLSPSGTSASFTNIASIPLTAVERIEVLTDGASAIYGSDAIAGVINFIMRKDYEGAETRLRYGSDSRGDTSQVQFGQVFGTSWDTGNVLFSYEYFNRDPLAAADRNYTASTDLSLLGGTDRRVLGGNPANIIANGETFAVPPGQDGTSLTPADFDPTIAPNLYNSNAFDDLIGESERHSATLFLEHGVGSLNLFGQARFSTEDSSRRTPLNFRDLIDIPVTDDSPFFVDPTGTGLTEVTVENYAIGADVGPSILNGEVESSGVTTGARLELDSNWSVELVGNWAKEEAQSVGTNRVDAEAVRAAANNQDPNLAFNPFGDGSNTNPAVLASLLGPDVDGGRVKNELWSASLNTYGELFDSSWGSVQLAAGLDYRDEALLWDSGTQIVIDRSRNVFAAYAELFFPFVSESNARAGLQRLELSVAARYEDYSDFGDTTNPKLGVLWSPANSLTLRGTYGTSYRAPTLRDLDIAPSSTNGTFYWPDFIIGGGLLQLRGANEDLQPEEAVTWTAGIQWRPERIRGLSVDLTYFDIDFENRISLPVRRITAALDDPSLASLVTLMPTTEQITEVANDARYDPDFPFWPFNVPVADLISGAAPVGAIVNTRRVNSAQLQVTGIQLQMAYSTDTSIGVLGFNLNGDYLFDYKRRIIQTDPLVEEVDTMGRPVDFRARLGANWSRGNWAVSGFINYTDGYTDIFSDPERGVDSWTTVDMTFAYDIDRDAGFFSNTRLALTVQNLLDEDPPFVDTVGSRGYDATVASPLGQFIILQMTKDW